MCSINKLYGNNSIYCFLVEFFGSVLISGINIKNIVEFFEFMFDKSQLFPKQETR